MKISDMISMGKIRTCSAKNPSQGCLTVLLGNENEIPFQIDQLVDTLRSKGIQMNALCPDFIIPEDRASHSFDAGFEGKNAVVDVYDKLSNKNKVILRLWPVEDPLSNFIIFHNYVNKNGKPKKDVVAPNSHIHPTAIIGNPSPLVVRSKKGELLKMKPMGRVFVESNVFIGAYSIVSKSLFDDTTIKSGSVILENVFIGPDCEIGHNVFIESGVVIEANTKIQSGLNIKRKR